jgi:hypothetical protein
MPRYAEPNATPEMIEELYDKLCQKQEEEFLSPFDIIPEKDFKVRFNDENFELPWMDCEWSESGFYEVNGTTIALCCAGGDWETPVYFAIYIEKGGKRLRAYIPTIGNQFDFYCKTAFGSQEDVDCESLWPKEFVQEDYDIYECARDSQLELWREFVEENCNVDDMLKDIASRIEGATPCVPFKKKPLKYNTPQFQAWLTTLQGI